MVKIWFQGAGRQFARGIPTIVPEPYLHIADNAKQEAFAMEPGKPFKKRSPIQRYTYEIQRGMGKNGEATEQEYLKMLQEGTKAAERFAAAQAEHTR